MSKEDIENKDEEDDENYDESSNNNTLKNTNIVDDHIQNNVTILATPLSSKNKEVIKESLNNTEIANVQKSKNKEVIKESLNNAEIVNVQKLKNKEIESDINEVVDENEEDILFRRSKKNVKVVNTK